MGAITLTAEAKAAMIANLELELNNRKEKLRAMCEAQCASLRSRLERRVNRVPATKRQTPLIELLAPSLPAPMSKPAHTKAAAAKTTTTKKAAAPAPATRKTRTAPASTTATTTKPTAPKTAATKPAAKQPVSRGKKRGSDEMSSEDKENAALDVPKKRVRAAAPKAPVPTSKPAASTRTTRAASRQKAAPTQILSPKNNNARQKPAKSSTRPR